MLELPTAYRLANLVVLSFLISIVTSLSVKNTIAEVAILIYLVALSITIYVAFKNGFIDLLFTVLIVTTFILSSIGLYDVIAINIDLPTIFNSVNKKHGISGFRNFGQAANYSFTMLTLLIPLKYSDLTVSYHKSKMLLLNITILLCLFFMMSTGRVSILISFGIGLLLFSFLRREKRILKDVGVFLTMIGIFIVITYQWMPILFKNILFRFESRIINRSENVEIANLFVDNIKNSFVSFFDNPWFGSGLGGFVNHYSEYEIHGTYFKVLGETGLVGVLGYLFFSGYLIYVVFRNRKSDQTNFFNYFLPFFIASLVSWGYNYHFRKKEFWILFAVVMILDVKNFRKTRNVKSK
jgi:hypothetical protein